MRLILASTSIYRAELLRKLGLPFETAAPGIDESPLVSEAPHEMVTRLAIAKAAVIAAALIDGADDALVIGSDQLALDDQGILGKPGSIEAANAQLARLSGKSVRFLTALCLINTQTGARQFETIETPVQFRQLSAQQIEVYVSRERPLDCAGAFKSEGLGIALFESIGGADPNALIGLPLISLCSMLQAEGVDVLAWGASD